MTLQKVPPRSAVYSKCVSLIKPRLSNCAPKNRPAVSPIKKAVATGAARARLTVALWLTAVTIQLRKPISAAEYMLICKTINQSNPCLSTFSSSLFAARFCCAFFA